MSTSFYVFDRVRFVSVTSLALVVVLLANGISTYAETITFILPLPVGESYVAQDLPYSESGYVFTDVFGSTGHVFTSDFESQLDSYLGLGDWLPTSVTSQILVMNEANASFSLVALDYVHSGAGRLQFMSSRGGLLLTPEFGSSGNLSFEADPLWRDITSFTITGIAGDPSQYGEFSSPDEAIIRSMVLVPEPSTYCMALAGIACGGFSMWRRRKRV